MNHGFDIKGKEALKRDVKGMKVGNKANAIIHDHPTDKFRETISLIEITVQCKIYILIKRIQ